MNIKLKNLNMIKKFIYLTFSPIFLMFILFGCEQPEEIKIPNEFALLRDTNSFNDSLYEATFSEAYQKYITEKDYNIAANILIAKGNALDYYLTHDTTYLKQCVNFISKNDNYITPIQNMYIRYYIGSQYDFDNKINESKKWLLDAITYCPNPDQETIVGFSHLILSGQYKRQSKLDSSQYHAIKALKVFELTKDTINISTVQYNLFRIASSMNDDANASKYLDDMIRFGKAAKDTINICSAYIGYAKYSTKVDTTFQKVIKYQDTLNHYITQWSNPVPNFLFDNSLLKVHIHIHNKDLKAAEEEFIITDSLANPSSSSDSYNLDDTRHNLSHLKTGSYDQKLFDKLLKISNENKNYYKSVLLLKNMIISKENAKEYEKAFFYLKEHNRIRDLLWDDDLKSKIYKYEKQFQTVKKEKKIIEQENALLQRNSIIGFLVFGLLAIGLIFIVFINRRKRLALEKEQDLQEDYTKQLLQNTESERSRIAGDLHDSVNHKLLQLSSKVKSGEQVGYEELTEVIEQVRDISHNLHPAMFEKVGLEKSIEELSRKTMETTKLQISTQIAYSKTLSTQQELQIYRIVEEALNNIIKHSKASHAFIKLVSTQSKLEVKIKDNGDGFDTSNLKNKKTSFGLMNIEQRTKAVKGIINIISSQKGTELDLIIKT